MAFIEQRDIRRLDLGFFIRPAEEAGIDHPRVEPVLGWLIRHPDGTVLFDTGMGVADDATDAHYRPQRRSLIGEMQGAGAEIADVQMIVNCHLHFDHCGGNPLFPDRSIVTQSVELDDARLPDCTFRELIDFPGATYERISGEVELLRDLWVVPTPGHTKGHQSLVVRCGDGTLLCAGQSHDSASSFASDVLAAKVRSALEQPAPMYPEWLRLIERFDPRRVVFAHDFSVVELPI